MAKGKARYTVTTGLYGCYMPNNSSIVEFVRRKDLADFIRREIEFMDWPKSVFSQVKISRVWRHIAAHGSSVAHFSYNHRGYELAFHGLTDAEYRVAQSED